MDVTFCLLYEPLGNRRVSPPGLRTKARSMTLGATRRRLFQVLRHLGLCREEIEARLREDREREWRRALRLQEEQDLARLREEASAARRAEEHAFARLREERKEAVRLREEQTYEAMTPEQQAEWRLEQEIVGWIGSVD